MRQMYQQVWREHFKDAVYTERKRLKLSQRQMSELLLMDQRTYSDLEHGNISCGSLTLILFLALCCENRAKFIEDALAKFKKAVEDEYASV